MSFQKTRRRFLSSKCMPTKSARRGRAVLDWLPPRRLSRSAQFFRESPYLAIRPLGKEVGNAVVATSAARDGRTDRGSGRRPCVSMLSGLMRKLGDGSARQTEVSWPDEILMPCPSNPYRSLTRPAVTGGGQGGNHARSRICSARICGHRIDGTLRHGLAATLRGFRMSEPIIGLAVGVLLGLYLLYTLIRPEKF
jgi:K+-transporting ATPase KdpF subunit